MYALKFAVTVDISPQGLTLRGWIDLTCSRETFVKKSIKFFDEALVGYVCLVHVQWISTCTVAVNFSTTLFLVCNSREMSIKNGRITM